MECPDLGSLSDLNLRASILSREVGGQVVFTCSPGFGLSGPAHSTCLPTGEWAQPIPVCKGEKINLYTRIIFKKYLSSTYSSLQL